MYQEIYRFHIGSFDVPIYGYGLMLVVGFLLAAQWARFLARRAGLDGDTFINGALLGLLAGVVGARLSHILENLSEFTNPHRSLGQNLLNMVNLRSGGLTYYGGFLLAFPTLVWYALHKKVPLRRGMDIVAPCLILALGFGRIGCFLNGCCYGAECDPHRVPWAVRFPYYSNAYLDEVNDGGIQPSPDLVRSIENRRVVLKTPAELGYTPSQHSLWLHPAQLYSTLTCFLLAALLYAYYTLPHAPGLVFALMLILEGTTRFLLEILRAEPAVLGRMSLSMIIGIGLVALGLVLWWWFRKLGHSFEAEA